MYVKVKKHTASLCIYTIQKRKIGAITLLFTVLRDILLTLAGLFVCDLPMLNISGSTCTCIRFAWIHFFFNVIKDLQAVAGFLKVPVGYKLTKSKYNNIPTFGHCHRGLYRRDYWDHAELISIQKVGFFICIVIFRSFLFFYMYHETWRSYSISIYQFQYYLCSVNVTFILWFIRYSKEKIFV